MLLKSNKIYNILLLRGDFKKISKYSIIRLKFCCSFFKNIYSTIYPEFYKKTISTSYEKYRIKKKKCIGSNRFVSQITLNLISLFEIEKNFLIKKKNIYVGIYIFSTFKSLFNFYKRCGVFIPYYFLYERNNNIFFIYNIIKFLYSVGFINFHFYYDNKFSLLNFLFFINNEIRNNRI
ncbi:hypothetical protein ACWNX6_00295 [Candidatus Vidania fulgoroideorum]